MGSYIYRYYINKVNVENLYMKKGREGFRGGKQVIVSGPEIKYFAIKFVDGEPRSDVQSRDDPYIGPVSVS